MLPLDDDDLEARLPPEEERPDELLVAELPFRTVVLAALPEELPELLDAADPERTPAVIPVPDDRPDGILVGRSARFRVRAVVVFLSSGSLR